MGLIDRSNSSANFYRLSWFALAAIAFVTGGSTTALSQRDSMRIPQPIRSVPSMEDPRLQLAQVPPVNVAAEETRRAQQERIEQVKIIGEINHLTVELFKRHKDPNFSSADTPALVKRLKELAAKLHN